MAFRRLPTLTTFGRWPDYKRFEFVACLARTDKGRKRAMARGMKFGRKPKLARRQIEEVRAPKEACPCRKSDPDVLMIQSAKKRLHLYASDCLNEPSERRIFAQP